MKRYGLFVSLLILLLAVSGCNFLAKTGTITGSVKDLSSGLAIEGATVTVKGSNGSVTTTANGTFTIGNVNYGKVELVVSAIGYVPKTVPVNVSQDVVSVEVQLDRTPVEVTDAKKLVKDFKTSLYEMGSIAIAESSVIAQFQNEYQQFFADIAPYVNEVAMGLEHLQVLGENPGEYNLDGYNQYGIPQYTLITLGDRNATKWTWTVTNPTNGMIIQLYSPNIDTCIVSNPDDPSKKTIDFTNTEFGYTITSSMSTHAIYTGKVNVGKDNIKSYVLTSEQETTTILIPSGKTIIAQFVIDSQDTAIGSILIDATFDLTEANSKMKIGVDGTITTPVCTYAGNVTIDIDGIGTQINPNIIPKSLTVAGKGVLTNQYFEITGTFSTYLPVKVQQTEYGLNVQCLPSRGTLEGKYKSKDTEFIGSISARVLNEDTFDPSSSWPAVTATLRGEVKHLSETYLLDLTATFEDGENIAIQTRLAATNKYDLAGTFNFNLEKGLTKASMVNVNGLFIDFNVQATDLTNIGGIYQKQGGPQFATMAVLQRETLVVSINFTDNTSEIISLDPLAYLIPPK